MCIRDSLVAVAVGEAVYQQLVAYVGAFAVVPRIGLGDDLLALEILGGIAALCHGDDDRIAARGGEGKLSLIHICAGCTGQQRGDI